MNKNAEVILAVTGGIAAYKAVEILRVLKQKGVDVTVVMTKEAMEFIRPLTMQALSGRRVIVDMFEAPFEWEASHVSLAERARCILIAPATANVLGKLAAGIADDMLTTLILACNCPVILAPAMNVQMYRKKVVQMNIERLKSFGYKFIGPVRGKLADGRVDIGHIASVEEIVKEVFSALKKG